MRRIVGMSILLLTGCVSEQSSTSIDQQTLTELGQSLDVTYQVVSNLDDSSCKADIPEGDCFTAQIALAASAQRIPANTHIYFSHISPVKALHANVPAHLEHINGDLHRVTFDEAVPAGKAVELTLSATNWQASRSDVMPNYYLTYGELQPAVIRSTTRIKEPGTNLLVSQHATQWSTEDQYKRFPGDHLALMDANYRYEENARSAAENTRSAAENTTDMLTSRVIPAVKKRRDNSGETVKAKALALSEEQSSLLAPAVAKLAVFGLTTATDGLPVKLTIEADDFSQPDDYQLAISASDITIHAASDIAANYALLTAAQLWQKDTESFPQTDISDGPRFGFRGVHIDVARHFPGNDAIDMLIDQMFMYKLNKLHLHLSDDEGWRLAIADLPELTDIGAFRCHDPAEKTCLLPQLGIGPDRDAPGNGFLTEAQYIALVQKAASRGIEVIPSFDMPGHSRAAIVSMNARFDTYMAQGEAEKAKQYLLEDPNDTTQYRSIQYYNDNAMNPCMDSTYTFIDKIMTSVIAMHEKAGVPLKHFHLGADEIAGAWKESPLCAAKGKDAENLLPEFIGRVQHMAQGYGLQVGGWSDGIEKSTDVVDHNAVYTNVWDLLPGGGSEKVAHLNALHIPQVLSFPDVLYLDFPYQNNPLEPGYYWGSKATSTAKVFSFMPQHLSLLSKTWTDRMGNAYEDKGEDKPEEILGIQSQLWSEVTVNQDAVEYMLFPRLLAFAERAWHEASWQSQASALYEQQGLAAAQQRDWLPFYATLTAKHLPLLVSQGINVRVPPPGAKIANGMLSMNTDASGLELEYSTDGEQWQTYSSPVEVNSMVMVRSRIKGTEHASRQAVVEPSR